MKKEILLPPTVKREMLVTFKVFKGDLYKALKFIINSPRANMLRVAALERGGQIYTGARVPTDFIPECDTTFDRSNKTINQTFANGITVESNFESNETTVFIDGQSVAHFKDMTTDKWSSVLYSIEQIVQTTNR